MVGSLTRPARNDSDDAQQTGLRMSKLVICPSCELTRLQRPKGCITLVKAFVVWCPLSPVGSLRLVVNVPSPYLTGVVACQEE